MANAPKCAPAGFVSYVKSLSIFSGFYLRFFSCYIRSWDNRGFTQSEVRTEMAGQWLYTWVINLDSFLIFFISSSFLLHFLRKLKQQSEITNLRFLEKVNHDCSLSIFCFRPWRSFTQWGPPRSFREQRDMSIYVKGRKGIFGIYSGEEGISLQLKGTLSNIYW